MRILLVTGSYPPMHCGVGDYTHRLALALSSMPGMSVAVLTSKSAGVVTDDVPSPITLLPLMETWSAVEAWKLVSAVREWKPDLLHIQLPTLGYGKGLLPFVAPLLARLVGVNSVLTWHEPLARRNAPFLLLRRALRTPVVVVRPNYASLLHTQLRRLVPANTLTYIPNASPIPRAQLTPEGRAEIRHKYCKGQARLVVYFGFLYRHKGVDLVFDAADPSTDHILIVGDSDQQAYKRELRGAAEAERWRGKVTFAGFLPAPDVASILAAADVVLLPFRLGGGAWNTSLHSARLNGAYTVTTSTTVTGYDATSHVTFVGVDAIDQMREAVRVVPPLPTAVSAPPGWEQIALAHRHVYQSACSLR